jgi:hypothetical protein
MTPAHAEPDATAARLTVPGYARDARRHTCLSAELPFFNDAAMAARLMQAGLEPMLETLPPRCRIADLGGADGYVAQACRDYLAGHGVRAEAVVVDANLESLRIAQRRGLEIVPCNLESVRLSPVNVALIRLVMQYNGLDAQRRILTRALECLVPGGLLILQAEAGALANVLFRNLLCRFLEQVPGSGGPIRSGRWLSTRGLIRLVRARGFVLLKVSEDFLTFETALEDLLVLAWTRFHGTPTTSEETRQRFEAFRTYANTLAARLLERGLEAGLQVNPQRGVGFSSRHVLILATKPIAAGASLPHAV